MVGVPRRVVIVLLAPVRWHPPGVDPAAWRAALAEDVVDLTATLSEVDAAIASATADDQLARGICWPGMPMYGLPAATVAEALAAAHTAGYDQAAVLAPDVPDLPGLLVGKLLRPLGSHPVAIAPAATPGDADGGLVGVACRLPAPGWLAGVDIDTGTVDEIRRAAPRPGDVAVTPAWRRLRGPAALAALDPAVEGWETTRALLTGP